jgi:L-ascorbate metabolism protein UlaG (beta-lactamase superfamily)
MSPENNTIYHLTQSSNLMKLNGKVFIFDYPESTSTDDAAGLSQGIINPNELLGESVFVIVSHSHGDHFHPDIFSWEKQIKDITYILSYDVPNPPENALIMRPGETIQVDDITIEAYSSTDAGVACSIFYNGLHIYFSGDNAFWNWDGDLDDDIYIRIALKQISKAQPIDIAFQVCDPRLDGMKDGGVHIFAAYFKPKLLVPIHAFGRYEFNQTAQERLRKKGFKGKFWPVKGRGDRYHLDNL